MQLRLAALVSTILLGLVPPSAADPVAELVRALPDDILQIGVVSGPADTPVRFVIVRGPVSDRLFIQVRDGGQLLQSVEVAEVGTTSRRLEDLRSEANAHGVVAFVDFQPSDETETAYELFIDLENLDKYVFQPVSN